MQDSWNIQSQYLTKVNIVNWKCKVEEENNQWIK
jgi:hypothetical protein